MRNDELNAAVARAERDNYSPTATMNMRMMAVCGWSNLRLCAPGPAIVGIPPGGGAAIKVSPATSLDALRTHVIPELKRRGKMDAWAEAVRKLMGVAEMTDQRWEVPLWGVTNHGLSICLSAAPATLCEAALAVMASAPKEKQ